jgi:hypothetical protein
MVQDEEGRWWAKHRETAVWNYYNGSAWVQGTPPGYEEAAPEPTTDEPPTPPVAAPHPTAEDGEDRRAKRLWVLAVGLVGMAGLIAIVVYFVAGSIGTETAELPNVVGKSRDQAEKELKSAGFEVAVKTRESSEEDAGKIIEQSPSGGEAKKYSVVAITVGEGPSEQAKGPEKKPAQDSGPAPGYNLIRTSDGGLAVEVPVSWEVQTGANSEGSGPNWSDYAGELLTASITTAPNLDAWYNTGAPGAYIVASRTLAQTYTDDELVVSGPNENWFSTCQPGTLEDFRRTPYFGRIQTWTCSTGGATVYTLAAAPEGRECVVLLQARIASAVDREAIQHIVDTFDVDCGEN